MNLAPVVLFVFNRPWHTRQTLEALQSNELAKDSLLYIFCDGPKENSTEVDLLKIKETRVLIREEKWCGDIKIIERDRNYGLANSVIDGVSKVIKKYGKTIVLEDDIVPGKYFLEYMNKALNIYESVKRVYGVSGYSFHGNLETEDSTYFLPVMSSWGYGTWADRWEKIDFNSVRLYQKFVSRYKGEDLDFGNIKYFQMLKDQISGKVDSWAIRFYVSMFLDGGVFLFPKHSLLQNIGFDGTGVHSGEFIPKHYQYNVSNLENIDIVKKEVTLKESKLEILRKSSFKVPKQKKVLKYFKKMVPPELFQYVRRKLDRRKKEEVEKKIVTRYTNTIVKLNGIDLRVPDISSYNFMFKEIFNNEIYKFYTGEKEPYIIDGGANIGVSTIYLKRLYPFSRIIAFEPDPQIFKILQENIEKFNFSNIELINKGLWDEEKELDFYSEGADAGLISELNEIKKNSIKIQAISLKEYLNEKVDFLKLDVEGAETVVLRDIESKLGNVKRIFLEYHSFSNQPQSIDEILKILISAGFRLHINSPGISSRSPFVKLNTYNDMDMQLNIFGEK